jgi:hypothetical protein
MIVVIMARDCTKRNAVAAALADSLACDAVYSGDAGFGHGAEGDAALRSRIVETRCAGRSAIFSAPLLSASACSALRAALPAVDFVRLLDGDDVQPPIAAALTLDATMSAHVLASTARAVLQLRPAGTRMIGT